MLCATLAQDSSSPSTPPSLQCPRQGGVSITLRTAASKGSAFIRNTTLGAALTCTPSTYCFMGLVKIVFHWMSLWTWHQAPSECKTCLEDSYSSTGNKTRSKFYQEIRSYFLFWPDCNRSSFSYHFSLQSPHQSLAQFVLSIANQWGLLSFAWLCLLQLLMVAPFVPHHDWQLLLWILKKLFSAFSWYWFNFNMCSSFLLTGAKLELGLAGDYRDLHWIWMMWIEYRGRWDCMGQVHKYLTP